MKISAQMPASAARAATGRTLSWRLRRAAYSLRVAIKSSAAMKGISWRVATAKASAAADAVPLATQKTGVRSIFHASAVAAITNMLRMAAVTGGGNTLKLKVSSQSMGARIRAEVPA